MYILTIRCGFVNIKIFRLPMLENLFIGANKLLKCESHT